MWEEKIKETFRKSEESDCELEQLLQKVQFRIIIISYLFFAFNRNSEGESDCNSIHESQLSGRRNHIQRLGTSRVQDSTN